jgi:ribosome biogenesis protein Nip4
MKLIDDFAGRFNATISLDESLVVMKQNRLFLLNRNLKRLVSERFFYVGTYLGKVKGGMFFPSFHLLSMIAEHKANKTLVDEKTEWLFICGRDVFKQGIVKVMGSRRKGDYTLVLNKHGECLGFGKIVCNIDQETDRHAIAVKSISDIGDFLRRERRISHFRPSEA